MPLMLFFSPLLSCFIVPPSRKRDLSSAAAPKENKAALALALRCWDGWRGLCIPNLGLFTPFWVSEPQTRALQPDLEACG